MSVNLILTSLATADIILQTTLVVIPNTDVKLVIIPEDNKFTLSSICEAKLFELQMVSPLTCLYNQLGQISISGFNFTSVTQRSIVPVTLKVTNLTLFDHKVYYLGSVYVRNINFVNNTLV